MKKQPDDGLDAVHTRIAVRINEARTAALGVWFWPEVPLKALLAECPDYECEECSRILCRYGDPLHLHHDGCPSCTAAWGDE